MSRSYRMRFAPMGRLSSSIDTWSTRAPTWRGWSARVLMPVCSRTRAPTSRGWLAWALMPVCSAECCCDGIGAACVGAADRARPRGRSQWDDSVPDCVGE